MGTYERLFIAIIGGSITPAGGPMNPTTISQWFTRKIKQYKLKTLSLHGLRHSCASYLLDKGVPLNVVAARLGDRTQTIDKIYSHVFKSTARSAAQYFDDNSR